MFNNNNEITPKIYNITSAYRYIKSGNDVINSQHPTLCIRISAAYLVKRTSRVTLQGPTIIDIQR